MHKVLKIEVIDPDTFRTAMRRLYPGYRYKTEDEALEQLFTGIQPVPLGQIGCRVRLVEPRNEPEGREREVEVAQAPGQDETLRAHVLELADEGLSLRAIRRRLQAEHGIVVSHTRVGTIIKEGRESA